VNLLDIIFLAILGFAAYRGYGKGFFKVVSNVAGYIVGLLGAFFLYKPLANFLGGQLNLREKLAPWITDSMALPVTVFQVRIRDVAVDQAAEIINQQKLPEIFKEVMMKYIDEISELPLTRGIETLGDGITYTVSNFIISAASFFIIYLGLSLLFRAVLPKLFYAVNPKPVKFIDKFAGAVLGLGGGLLSLTVLVFVLTPLASVGVIKGNPSPLADLIGGSILADLIMTRLNSLFYL